MTEWTEKKEKSESEVTHSFPTLCDPMDCRLPGSSVHGIFQARVLEWVAISFSRGSSQPRDWTQVSHIAGRRFTVWATREATKKKEKECPFVPSKLPDLGCYQIPGSWADVGAHAGLDGIQTAGRVLVIEPPPQKKKKNALSGLLGWEQSPRAPKAWWPNPLTSRTLESHLTLGLLVLWCPIQAAFLTAEAP